MARLLLAGGFLAALMGAALIPPVLVARLESGGLNTLGIGIVCVGCGLIAFGVTAVTVGFRRRVATGMPSGVRAAVTANVFFLAFFALELSDRLIRRDGKLFYWSTLLFPPALALFCGLLAAQPWAWRASRGAAALGVVWFLGFLARYPVCPLGDRRGAGPVAWAGLYGLRHRRVCRNSGRCLFDTGASGDANLLWSHSDRRER